jgi:hypothetical protein
VHGIGELLRRFFPKQRPKQCEVGVQGVEDKWDLQPVHSAEASIELW